jgi:RNA polymerase sigma-70 factor (ECF subfamily)
MAGIESFDRFLETHQHVVYSTALRLLANEADALDIAQEVFLKAHTRFAMLENNPAAGAWLKKVATNLSLNHLTRYRARWRFFSELNAEKPDVSFEESLASGQDRGEQEDQAFRRHHLEQALAKLPPAQRVPLVLYHFEDLSYESIAARLGISLSKVKTDIHRAREALRRWLTPNMDQWRELPAGSDPGDTDSALSQNLFPWPAWPPSYWLEGMTRL